MSPPGLSLRVGLLLLLLIAGLGVAYSYGLGSVGLLGPDEPRYASMAGIMKARKKPLDVVTDEELGVKLEPKVEVLRYHSAEMQRRCERVSSVDELLDRLQGLAGLLS